jgi:hypothetical protein
MNIRIKIDVTKVDKARLFKGKKGTYLDATLIESRDSKFGDDYFIVQDVSKEERAEGVKGAIIGNARNIVPKQQAQAQPPARRDDMSADAASFDDMPF